MLDELLYPDGETEVLLQSPERISAALKDDAPCTEPEKAVHDCLCRIERCGLAEQIEEIKRQLSEPALTEEQRADYIRNMLTLNQRMRGLN